MTTEEAKRILAAYRPGDQDRVESCFAEALQKIEKDPELARWFAQEREFNRAVATHLGSVPVPFGLKTRILANVAPRGAMKSRWPTALTAAAFAFVFFALLVGVWRGWSDHFVSVGDYEQEVLIFLVFPPAVVLHSLALGIIDYLT